MAALARAHDWESTPLGPLSSWPQSLRTTVSIVLQSHFGMYIAWGPEFTQIYNDGYRPILGSTKHPALGKSTRETFAESWHIIGPMFERVRSGESIGAEDWMLPLDRNGYLEECYFIFSYSPIRDEAGDVGGVLVTASESTQRVLSERRLRTLRDLAARATEVQTPALAWLAARDALAANPADVPFALFYEVAAAGAEAHLVATTGLSPGDPAAPRVVSLEGNEPWPLGRAMRASETLTELGRFGELPSGTWSTPPTTAVVVPIARAGDAQPYGLLVLGVSAGQALNGAYREFHALIASQTAAGLATAHAYEDEKRRAETLAGIIRDKIAFFTDVSHEFRTPLTLLLGPTEEALSSVAGALTGDGLETVHLNGLRLLKLVNALLDYTRIEAGRTQALFEPVDLALTTRDLASTFRSVIENAGMTLTVDCDELPDVVHVDTKMWEKVILNLLSNAFQFTFEGGVAVSLRAIYAGRVELAVSDTGIGIPQDELKNVFNRFYRVPGARSRTHEGSGIGLALTFELVRLLGGTLRVYSTLGEGSTFIVSLPLGTAHVPAAPGVADAVHPTSVEPSLEEALRWIRREPRNAESEPGSEPTTSRPRVLVVEDDADMRDFVRRLLSLRFTVEAVADGKGALAAIKRRVPDLMVCDVVMAQLDGLGLLRVVRADPAISDLKVLLLSARAGEESRVMGLEAGADDYLDKPFAPRELLARVQTQIDLALAQRASKEARARLYNQFMQAPVAISVVVGPELVFELANPRYEALVGRSGFVGKPLREVFRELPADAPVLVMLEDIYRRGIAFTATNYRVSLDRRGDGVLEDGFFHFTCQPLIAADGSVEGLMTVAIDVTPQELARAERDALLEREKQTRAEVDAQRERLHRVLMQAPAMVSLTSGPDHVFELANPRYMRAIGNRQVIGRPIREALPELEGQGLFEMLDDIFATGRRHVVNELPVKLGTRADGRPIEAFFNATYEPMLDHDGRPEGVMTVATDVTEQVLARRRVETLANELRQSELLFRASQDASPIAFSYHRTVYAPDGAPSDFELVYQNAAAERINHVPAGREAAGSSLLETFPGLVGSDLLATYMRVATTGQTEELETFYDGEHFDSWFRVVVLRPTAQLLAFMFEDISARKHADKERERLIDALERSNAELDQFAYVAAHDLKAPLRGVSHLSQWIEADLGEHLTSESRQHMELLRGRIYRLESLIDGILSYSRAGRCESSIESVDVAKLLREVIELLAPPPGATFEIGPGMPTLDTERVPLEQVFMNLVGNALKHAQRDDPCIQISVAGNGDQYEFAIRDNGQGVAVQYHERIWKIFQKLESRDKVEGAGIGLAVVRKIVEVRGGRAWVESTPPAGATFKFTWDRRHQRYPLPG